MCYKSRIKPIIFVLSIVIGILMGAFPTVIAQEESANAEETETTDEAEASEEASEGDTPVRLESLVVVGTRAQPRSILDSAVPDRYCFKRIL